MSNTLAKTPSGNGDSKRNKAAGQVGRPLLPPCRHRLADAPAFSSSAWWARPRLFIVMYCSLLLVMAAPWATGIQAMEFPWLSKPGSLGWLEEVRRCTVRKLHADLSFLDSAEPIAADEFLQRRDRLARALAATGIDASILEPGYTFQYYANISQPDWEPWEPEERPFLMLVQPEMSNNTGKITARTAFLAPRFEEGRVRMLGIPSEGPLHIVTWEEHWNPYETLRKSELFSGGSPSTVMVDEELRDFISRGMASAGFETVGLNAEVELVRQVKSPAEIEILRAVNTATVAAVRALQGCLEPGITEKQARGVLDAALASIDLEPFFDIVLFEEHAALPHGGFVTGDKKLEPETMVLIDVGAHYMGYSSDICRSFFVNPPRRSIWSLLSPTRCVWLPWGHTSRRSSEDDLHDEKLKVWSIVFEAQTAAAEKFKHNNSAASVDIAAREVIEAAGYGRAFTHRVGHGIGIKAHESPYLNKWNTDALLRPGMVFTNEPGIYLEGRFGVRHEDVYLIKEAGEAELLTGQRAMGPYEP